MQGSGIAGPVVQNASDSAIAIVHSISRLRCISRREENRRCCGLVSGCNISSPAY